MSAACTVPPEGWTCTREPGHDGPCAALPDSSVLRFEMPACLRHFRRHRWWCRSCRREAADQFREVVETLWRVRSGCAHRWHNLHGGGQVCSRCCDRRR